MLQNGYYQAIDTAGRIVADSLRSVFDSYPGYAVFDEGMFPYVRNYQFGFKNVHNQVVVPPIYNVGPADVSPADDRSTGARFRNVPRWNKMPVRPVFSSGPAYVAPASMEEGDCVGTQFRDGVAIVVSADEKFGLINRRGELVAACIYDYIGPPEGGVYGARRGDSLFLLNRKGENILPFPYQTDPKFFPYPRVRNGLLCVMVLNLSDYTRDAFAGDTTGSAAHIRSARRSHNYKVGFVDTTGRLVIDTTLLFGAKEPGGQRVAGVSGILGNKDVDAEEAIRWEEGQVQYDGSVVATMRASRWKDRNQNPPRDPYYLTSDYYRFSGGRCLVWNGFETYVINTRNEKVFRFDDSQVIRNADGFFVYRKNDQYSSSGNPIFTPPMFRNHKDKEVFYSTWGLTDPYGKLILFGQQYLSMKYTGNGMFAVRKNGRQKKWSDGDLLFYADTAGRHGFRKGRIGPGNVERMDRAAHRRRLKGYRILGESEGLVLVCKPGKHQQPDRYGMVDGKGHWTIAPDYLELRLFQNGLAPFATMVVTGPGSYSKKLWGYLDKSGRVVLPPQYEEATGFLEVPSD